MPRLPAIFVAVTVLLSPGSAQDESASDLPPLSLQRLTIAFTPTYFRVPWEDLNQSFDAARESIGYSSSWTDFQGHIDRVTGDVSIVLPVSYRIIGGLDLMVLGLYTESAASFFVQQQTTGRVYCGNEIFDNPLIRRTNSFSNIVRGYGLGLRYMLTEKPGLSVYAVAGRAFSRIDYLYYQDGQTSTYEFRSHLRSGTSLGMGGIEAQINLWGPISIGAGLHYRLLLFKDIRGTGTYTQVQLLCGPIEHTYDVHTELIRAGDFYGITDSDGGQPIDVERYILHHLWYGTPGGYDWQTQVTPATLDLSGFGVSLDLRVSLP